MEHIMKIIINENERGFRFKNGTFHAMMAPGKHTLFPFLGETYFKTSVNRLVTIKDIDIEILLKDKNFCDSIAKIEVPDGHLCLYYEDGRLVETLETGVYYFWKIFHTPTFELVSIREPRITLSKDKLEKLPNTLYQQFIVTEGQVGLLYYDGKFEETLNPGTYKFWKNETLVAYETIDLRAQQLDINSQEILTADKVTLRLNFVCTYKILNPVEIRMALKDYTSQIYVTTQLALRACVGRMKFDELLEKKDAIAHVVLSTLREQQKDLFIEFIDAGLKDIILPGEIRDIMNTVLVAEKNAQANVLSRREEVASTRSLLNTAKLMEENTTLYKLKELEYLEKICDKVGNISVGNGNLLTQLSDLLSTRNA